MAEHPQSSGPGGNVGAPIATAVIGYGLSARIFHIPFILALPDHFHLHTIVQRNPDAASNSTGVSASNDHPSVTVRTSPESMFADPEVSLVIITTPPDSHFKLASAALRAGKHVIVEKPFVPTAAEARELADIAKECGKLLSVYQNRRWDADFVTLKMLVEDGYLGRVVEGQSHIDRFRPEAPDSSAKNHAWKSDTAMAGNGALYDLGTHLIDQAVHLFGLPTRVTGFLARQRDGVVGGEEVPVATADSFTVILHYSNGMMFTVKAGVLSVAEDQMRFWVRSTEGTYRKHFEDVQEPSLKAGAKVGEAGFGKEPQSSWGTIDVVGKDGVVKKHSHHTVDPPPTYLEYYRHMAMAIKTDSPVPVTPQEAASVLHIIERAVESSRTWKTVEVRL
jgi:hypothetical protein